MAGPFGMHVVIAVAAGGAGIVTAVFVRLVLRRAASRAGGRWRARLADLLAYLLPWAAVITGAWIAVLSLVAADSQWRPDADHALLALIVLAATLAAARTATEAVRGGVLRHSGISGSATIFVNITRGTVLVSAS